MADLHDTPATLAKQTLANALRPLRHDCTGSVPWPVATYVAGVLLALLSAPFVPY